MYPAFDCIADPTHRDATVFIGTARVVPGLRLRRFMAAIRALGQIRRDGATAFDTL